MKQLKHKEGFRLAFMLCTAFLCMMTFVIVQPYGDGPDEINRFKLVEYIYAHGTLPRGDDPEVLIDGYGGSYAFQPMLTYIIDGYLLRALRMAASSLEMRVLLSRIVNVVLGLLTAIYVKKASGYLFSNSKTAWAFTLAVVFLPQNLFIHTYVNTDSMGLLSIAMVVYALLKGMREDFSKSSCITLAVGIILCALSYYNCYGIILCAMIVMAVYFFAGMRTPSFNQGSESEGGSKQNAVYDGRALLQKGGFVAILVLLGIAWWFLRNMVLYDGDLLAMNARALCAAQTSIEAYNPLTRDTYQKLGIPLTQMVFGTDYFTLVWKSFIAMFGPMLIPTHHYIYMAFRDLFFLALLGLLLPFSTSALQWETKPQKWLTNAILLLAIVIPVILALVYSYSYDFQPQGRYYLPIVLPLMYFLAIGVEKLFAFAEWLIQKIGNAKAAKTVNAVLYHLLYAFLTCSLLYSTFVAMLGYYRANG